MTNLNKEQHQAVTTTSKYTLIIAGAGTGKTRVLTSRIAYLLEQGIKDNEILAFTFTNKAAEEMRGRVRSLINRPHKIIISTFHSYCYQILKEFHDDPEDYFNIIDDDDKTMIIRQLISNNGYKILDKVAIKAISFIKNHASQNLELYDQILVNSLFHKYQDYLRANNKMDLDDLQYYTYLMLKDDYFASMVGENIKHILIDECQDTNKIQMNIIYRLGYQANLFLVGDLNQAIYAFRGSDSKNSEDFIRFKNPEIIKLSQNYRSSETIISAANTLIHNNKMQIKNYLSASSEFDTKYQIICAKLNDECSEAEYVCNLLSLLLQKGYNHNDIAILYRNNSVTHILEKELLLRKVPYFLPGSFPFFRHKEIKTLINYYRFIYNHSDNFAFEQIVNTPPRGIGKETVTNIIGNASKKNISYYESAKQLAGSNPNIDTFLVTIAKLRQNFNRLTPLEFLKTLIHSVNYLDYILKQPDNKSKMNRLYDFHNILDAIVIPPDQTPSQATINFLNELTLTTPNDSQNPYCVKLMTIHQAKGLEFPVVIIIGLNQGILPPSNLNTKEMEEERRLFYVAITRAKQRLYLLSTHHRTINGKKAFLRSSPFLNEISDCLVNTKG